MISYVSEEDRKWPVVLQVSGNKIEYIGPSCIRDYVVSLVSAVSYNDYIRQDRRIVVSTYDIRAPMHFYQIYSSISSYMRALDQCILDMRNINKLSGDERARKSEDTVKTLHQLSTTRIGNDALAVYVEPGDFVVLKPLDIVLSIVDNASDELISCLRHEYVHYDLGQSDFRSFQRQAMGGRDSWGGVFTNSFDMGSRESLDYYLLEMLPEFAYFELDMRAFDELFAYSLVDYGDMYHDPYVRAARERGVDTEGLKKTIQECKRRHGMKKTIEIGLAMMNRSWADSKISKEPGNPILDFKGESVFQYVQMLTA